MHPVAGIIVELDVLSIGRLRKARPAGTGIELRVRAKKLRVASSAAIDPVIVAMYILARERPLGTLTAQYLVLLGGELLSPLLLAGGYFLSHGSSFCALLCILPIVAYSPG